MKNTNDLENRKEKWLKENVGFSQLLSNNIIRLNPEIGFFIKVNGLNISQDFFEDEFNQISNAYHSVMKKLDNYYKENKNEHN